MIPSLGFEREVGYFWFFNSANIEVFAKVLNACSSNQLFWFYAGGLTDVKVRLTVTDTRTAKVQIYDNPPRTPFRPIQDSNAFATCP